MSPISTNVIIASAGLLTMSSNSTHNNLRHVAWLYQPLSLVAHLARDTECR
jgi:hypothetical protein